MSIVSGENGMMRKNLVIVNYMRVNPTIVDDLTKLLSCQFDRILVVNPQVHNGFTNIACIPGVEIKTFGWLRYFVHLVKLPFSVFRKEVLRDIKHASRLGKLSARYLKELALFVHRSGLLESLILQCRELRRRPEEWSILSVWYNVGAYAAARVKARYPKVRAVSMAHSFEVDPTKNDFVEMMKHYMQEVLDEVAFIAEDRRMYYLNEVAVHFGLRNDNITLRYWGCKKKFESTVTVKPKDYLLVVSCSTVGKVKRVDLIANALLKWEGKPIKWVHFGDGPQFGLLKEVVGRLGSKENVSVHLAGRVHNDDVHRFYANHDVDLFINVSLSEGLPISIMEAMAYGIPVLATDVGGTKEIVTDGQNGWLLPRDPREVDILDGIQKIAGMATESLIALKTNAQRTWADRFNIDRNIKDYARILSGDTSCSW